MEGMKKVEGVQSLRKSVKGRRWGEGADPHSPLDLSQENVKLGKGRGGKLDKAMGLLLDSHLF